MKWSWRKQRYVVRIDTCNIWGRWRGGATVPTMARSVRGAAVRVFDGYREMATNDPDTNPVWKEAYVVDGPPEADLLHQSRVRGAIY